MQLTLPELTAARGFLGQARMLVAGVHSLFFNIGEASTAARLNDIDGRIADEVQAIDRLIAGTSSEQRRLTQHKQKAAQVAAFFVSGKNLRAI